TCDTCRKARKWLDRFGVPHEFVDYRDDRPGPETLVEWARQAGGFESLVNKSSTTWRQLPDNRKGAASEPEWKLLLREYPRLGRRPVVVTGDGVSTPGFGDQGFESGFGGSPAGPAPAGGYDRPMSEVLELACELIAGRSV